MNEKKYRELCRAKVSNCATTFPEWVKYLSAQIEELPDGSRYWRLDGHEKEPHPCEGEEWSNEGMKISDGKGIGLAHFPITYKAVWIVRDTDPEDDYLGYAVKVGDPRDPDGELLDLTGDNQPFHSFEDAVAVAENAAKFLGMVFMGVYDITKSDENDFLGFISKEEYEP